MAIAAPRVRLLRQLAKAKDDYTSGAFDIAWDGGLATIFMVFGQPSHAVFESGGVRLDGEAALDALLRELPTQFAVSDWRRALAPGETLTLTVDDITEPLAELVGERAEAPDDDDALARLSGHDDSPDLGFDIDSFPLLPGGPALWVEAAAEMIPLAERIGSLDAALIVLTGPRLRAAGVIRNGELIDAVWVDSADHARGETAAMALLGAREGTLAGYALDGDDVAEAVPMLWRLPRGEAIDTAWVDAAGLVASLLADNDEHVLLIEGTERAAGLFSGGAVVAAYTASAPTPVRSIDILVDAMSRPATKLRVLQRRTPQITRRAPTPPVRAPQEPAPEAPAAQPPPRMADEEQPFEFAIHDIPAAAPSGFVSDDAAPAEFVIDNVAVAAPAEFVRDDARHESPAAEAASPGNESSWVNYDEVRRELAAIAVAWLGDQDAAPVTACVLATPSAVEDFITTIDTVRHMTLPGHDAPTMYAMAREMHVHAAERLCGA
ncbi:MAG TPA: hypothetical protein VF155_05375 [Candidatus Dormibacteraeota bacterium]